MSQLSSVIYKYLQNIRFMRTSPRIKCKLNVELNVKIKSKFFRYKKLIVNSSALLFLNIH